MSGWEQLAVFLGGLAAGAMNTVVGAGTLITFPLLLAIGVPPVVANVSNTIGLVTGSASGAVGYRRELQGQRSRLLKLGSASALGGLTGGIVLLALPERVFEGVVPLLLGVACVLVLLQPVVARRLERRAAGRPPDGRDVKPGLWAGLYLGGIYGGYFGAAQGVMLMGLLGVGLNEGLQRINAAKNVLAAVVNVVPAILFALVADVSWEVALLLAAGAALGGQLGARIGRRLSAPVLRGTVVAIGLAAIARSVVGW